MSPGDCAIVFREDDRCETFISDVPDIDLLPREKIVLSLESILSSDPLFVGELIRMCDILVGIVPKLPDEDVNRSKGKCKRIQDKIASVEDAHGLIQDIFKID